MSSFGGSRSVSAWKTLVWKALSDNGCTREMLEIFIEVFAIDENPIHEHRLRTLHVLRYGSDDSTDPVPADRWVPEAILSQVGSLRRHRTVSVHDVHTVGADRRPVSHRSTQVVEAISDGCDRYFFNYDARSVEVEILAGGRLVDVYETDGGLRCNEIAFGRTIPVGESHRFEILVRFLGGAELPPQVRRASADRIRSLYLEVVFDPDTLPSETVWAEWDCLDTAEPSFTQPSSRHRSAAFIDSWRERTDRWSASCGDGEEGLRPPLTRGRGRRQAVRGHERTTGWMRTLPCRPLPAFRKPSRR